MRHTKKTSTEKATPKEKGAAEPSFNSALDAILSPFWAPRMAAPDIHAKQTDEEPETLH